MTEEKKIKNGTPFWWERIRIKKNPKKKFRRPESTKELLESLRKPD